ncbi:MAG: ankyrin repeat domain-containing protein [Leptospiraceae bacterium]|nr:ankyrin repeat domain-containing protein [Leptospiraceae bacterium]
MKITKFINILLIIGMTISLGNCMTFYSLTDFTPSYNDYSLIYRGVRDGISVGLSSSTSYHNYGPPGFFYLFDVPFSFVFDTIALPYTIPRTLYYKYKFSKNLELFEIIKKNKFHELKKLVPSKKDINSSNFTGATLLMEATNLGKVQIIKYLIENGANTKLKDEEERTALSYSLSDTSNFESYKALVDFDKKIIIQNNYEFLFETIEYGNFKIFNDLLSLIPEIEEIKNNEKQNILIFAAKMNVDIQIFNELLKKNFDFDEKDNEGYTALHFASANGNLIHFNSLLKKKVNINSKTNENDTPLTLALNADIDDSFKIAETLLNLTTENDLKGNLGENLLHIACQNGQLEIVKKLIAKKVDVNAKNHYSQPAIFTALNTSHYDANKIVMFLLDNNANIDFDNGDGKDLFHHAAEQGSLVLVQALIKKGKDINKKDDQEQTPIVYAFQNYKWDVVQFLVKSGADINSIDNEGKNALWHAINVADENAIQTLVNLKINLESDQSKEAYELAKETGLKEALIYFRK